MKIDPKLLKSAVLGLAVGDAFGMPYECGVRGAYDVYADARDEQGSYTPRGYRVGMPAYFYKEDMPPGIWTDDTSMVLCELESIARLSAVDPDDIMRNFCRWHFDNEFSPAGVAIGQGRQTIAALNRYRSGTEATLCGGTAERDNGDGSLMRMLPFAFTKDMMDQSGVTIRDLSALTHGHAWSVTACGIYVDFARRLASGADRDELIASLRGYPAPFDRLGDIAALPEEEISSSGFVVHALEAALWCFFHTDSFEDCVMTAINLGGDADTIAAIAGSLAGLCRGVPERWVAQLARREEIIRLCDGCIRVLEG